ncbi:DMT family transporter [Candidatus Darwinibacter acetoxidans]
MDAQVAAHLGELAALTAALCWSLNSLAFEAAGRRVGSLAVNYLRIFVAFPLLTLTAWLTRGLALPLDAPPHAWLWLSISGLVGFVFGDIFLFRAFVEIGSRISLLIRSLGPPITALLSFLLLGERLAPRGLVGIFLVTLGISLVILGRSPQEKKVRLNRPLKGVIYAALGAVGEALGMVLSKLGMGSYNALAATQIRLLAAFLAFTLIITWGKKWPEMARALRDLPALRFITLGAILGPFLGVAAALFALQRTPAGIASSLTSLSPVLIIPFSMLIFKEKVLPKEVLGALISIAGVALLFL